jgi:hypothetical protein
VLLLVLAPAPAAPAVGLEPLQLGVARLDAAYTESAGMGSRTAARLGLGARLRVHAALELGFALGKSSGRTDFGLLGGPSARLERSDASVELAWRTPLAVAGWALQAAAGAGRLTLRYHPDALALDLGGETYVVALDDVGAWTEHVAAELLHGLSGRAQIVLRTAWTFYALRIATPAGDTRQRLADLHLGLSLRVPAW